MSQNKLQERLQLLFEEFSAQHNSIIKGLHESLKTDSDGFDMDFMQKLSDSHETFETIGKLYVINYLMNDYHEIENDTINYLDFVTDLHINRVNTIQESFDLSITAVIEKVLSVTLDKKEDPRKIMRDFTVNFLSLHFSEHDAVNSMKEFLAKV